MHSNLKTFVAFLSRVADYDTKTATDFKSIFFSTSNEAFIATDDNPLLRKEPRPLRWSNRTKKKKIQVITHQKQS